MADDADRAAQIVEDAQERALTARLARMRFPARSAVECEACGEPIPPARRQAAPGCTLCIDCAEEAETRR